MNADVENWFAGLAEEQRTIAEALRGLVLSRAPELREELKWGQPCYSGRSLVCHIQKARKHVALGFAEGARLDDPAALLEGSGARMRHVKVPLGTPPDAARLARLVDAALALDRSG